ncbi:DUF3536 domain-containing protein [Tunturiibacter empetritectus]|uniref:DUF3536 domain-containing protein n=1 Tax=Tunturiibacter empetritectus TaxID=3069691 RepID=UPI003D9B0B8C
MARPLRDALDYLRDATAPLAEQLSQSLFKDLWARPRRLHSGRPRPLSRLHHPFLRRPHHPPPRRRRTCHRTRTHGARTPHPAHVH